MPFGAEIRPAGGVLFRIWAPAHQRLQLVLADTAPLLMMRRDDGWHELVASAQAGARYQFRLPDGTNVPDPASRWQPEDVHGPSEVIDPLEFRWTDAWWTGRAWNEAILYELHIGTFTPEGTFTAAIQKLDHLLQLGITAIEVMPIADFPGRRNWGYDGVLPYAPDSRYGCPSDFKALIDAAHQRGLMVILDVVYNHFGPDGNYLALYAPSFFTARHDTPWGNAINVDGAGSHVVRDFLIHNALYWLEEYHLDGLRLDAVHAILDKSRPPLLEELAQRVRASLPGRHLHLILENERNNSEFLRRRPSSSEPIWYTAQWNDDVHHLLHVAATGECSGYFSEYLRDAKKLPRALSEGFAYQGELMEYRGKPRGSPSGHLPAAAFIAFIQNHDQVGNRPLGERITQLAPPAAVRAISAVYLLLPQIPMLFMGEEWDCIQPFLFFCDFSDELGSAVREGRKTQFARFPALPAETALQQIPDPQSELTFAASKLDWEALARPMSQEALQWHRRILAVRREHIVGLVDECLGIHSTAQLFSQNRIRVEWCTSAGRLALLANLTDKVGALGGLPDGKLLWQEGHVGEDGCAQAWTVRWSIDPSERSPRSG